jgi:lauroyl/myristoyl acyltransferase
VSPTNDAILPDYAERRPPVLGETRMITAKDLCEVQRIAAQGVLAWTLPEAVWSPLSRLFGEVDIATHSERTRGEMSQIAIALAGTSAASHVHRIALENWINRYEERFHYLRAWRPGGWKPEIEIAGGHHVSAALDRGRGIVFWAGNFSFNDLVAKMAWYRLGLEVSHFSRPTHGFSQTRFGIRYLNAVRRRIEDRYLGERLMTEPHETPIALQRMRERLKANGCVSITVGDRGRRTAVARFLHARLVLATGPLAMARTTGASLLPVFTLRKKQGHFEVIIGAPIEVTEDAQGRADYAAAVQKYADMVTPFVLLDPGQWRGWRYTRAWSWRSAESTREHSSIV